MVVGGVRLATEPVQLLAIDQEEIVGVNAECMDRANSVPRVVALRSHHRNAGSWQMGNKRLRQRGSRGMRAGGNRMDVRMATMMDRCSQIWVFRCRITGVGFPDWRQWRLRLHDTHQFDIFAHYHYKDALHAVNS